jgi:hypothetical protein
LPTICATIRSRPAAGGWAVEARLTHRATVLEARDDRGGRVISAGAAACRSYRDQETSICAGVAVEAAGTSSASDLRTLKRGQDILGGIDVRKPSNRVGKIQASVDPPDLTLWRNLDVLTMALENDCRRLHARFMRHQAAVRVVCDRVNRLKVATSARRAAAS